ncbi:MAG TPA: winged helix-turn-helix transcriptional regulator [Caldilineaceae bacterium]|nr:winged helix-turn-helix transcriptional regulator [Caldilineaceae bacterium]
MSEPELTSHSEYELLEALAATPVTSQADLAARVGLAVGTVNWYLKRWSKKGYVKVKRISRWQWSYLLTPDGIARKARLAGEYVEASLALYRRMRTEAREQLAAVLEAGYNQITLAGEGEIADICQLTCLELGLAVLAEGAEPCLPRLRIEGVRLMVEWPVGRRPAEERAGALAQAAKPDLLRSVRN